MALLVTAALALSPALMHRGALPLTLRHRAAAAAMTAASTTFAGDVATVRYTLAPDLTSRASSYGESAEKLIDSLPFDVGEVTFGLGSGGYLDGIISTVEKMDIGERKTGVSIDAGAGDYNEAGVATVPASQAPAGLATGMSVMLTVGGGQVRATVTAMDDESITLDTNHPLAGCRLLLDVELTARHPASAFETATFAGGCFWGLELAYQREPGVVATAVGYTQGDVDEPSYEAVCSGATGHTEAVRVQYDPKAVSYERLCQLLVDRLGDNLFLLNQVGNDRGTQCAALARTPHPSSRPLAPRESPDPYCAALLHLASALIPRPWA
jgi:FKBP-type peptidyl-prolyl cis-trans isomerase 2